MAKTVKRKISFSYLFLKKEDEELSVKDALNNLLSWVETLTRVDRKQNMANEKFDFLDSYSIQERNNCTLVKLMFKSAKHSYRAPLLNKNTVEARENPKTMAEGEQMKTHAVIKYKNGDAIMFLETGNGMLSCNNIVDYLNNFILQYNEQAEDDKKIDGRFSFDMIPRDDFREALDRMSRVIIAEVYTDKAIIGSEFLNLSEPTEEMQENIVLTIKSERKKDIKNSIYGFVHKLTGANSVVKRLRVKGKSGNNECIIDTAFIIKKEFVEAQQDEDTGEFNTLAMFEQLVSLSDTY